MDLARVAISTVLYFVPPPVMVKLKPAIITVFNQLTFYSGGKISSEHSPQPADGSAPVSASILETAEWTPVSAALINSGVAQTQPDVRRRLHASDLQPCSKTHLSLMLQGNDGVTLNFPVPANAKSVNVSFQQSAPGCVGIALAVSSEGAGFHPQVGAGSDPQVDNWRGVNLQGIRGGSSRPPLQDVLTYMELLYCVSFIGGLVIKAIGPVFEYTKSLLRVAFASTCHLGATWLAKLLRLILASLPEGS